MSQYKPSPWKEIEEERLAWERGEKVATIDDLARIISELKYIEPGIPFDVYGLYRGAITQLEDVFNEMREQEGEK